MSESEKKFEPQVFSMKSQLLQAGSITTTVATSDLMSVAVKIYASGGENAMHNHPQEDHTFLVLQGQATFRIGTDDNVKVVNKNEGVMLPAGANYWFQSSAEDNLVMIRIGAARKHPDVWRAFPDGRPFDTQTIENRHKAREKKTVFADEFFGA